MNKLPLITLICPAYNEETTIEPFYRRLTSVLESLAGRFEWEILFTDNASTDRTHDALGRVATLDPLVKTLSLTRNFGYQGALIAGLSHAAGDAVIIIDVDCEDPPELIPRFLDEWEDGSDVVYGIRRGRPEPGLLRLCRMAFYRLSKLVADSEIILDMAEFGLLSRPVVTAVLVNRSTFPFIRSEVAFVGFPRKGIPYDRGPRIAGETHYRLWGLVRFAIAGILAASTFPLRLAAYLCPAVLIATALLAARDLFPIAVLLDLSYLVVFTAMTCLYLARTYKNGVARPLFLVDWNRSVGWSVAQNVTGTRRSRSGSPLGK